MSKLIKEFRLFENLDENSDSDEYISQTLKDIFLEIEDEGVKCNVDHIRFAGKPITYYFVKIDVNDKLTDREKRSGFLDLPDWFIECINRAINFMDSNGFIPEYYVKLPTGWVELDDLEDLIECNWLVFQIKINFILKPRNN